MQTRTMTVATEPMSPHATSVLRQFRMVLNAVKAHFQQVEKHVGLGGAQVWALSIVAQQPGIGTNALACAMDVHQSTASNLVRALTGKGLIQATRDAVDRRAVHLQASEEGLALLARAPGPWTGVLPQALNQMSPHELEQLAHHLSKLISQLGASVDPHAARTPLANL
jgi:MarR family transcriptional regulator, organic hydroperoxide resistance regulator